MRVIRSYWKDWPEGSDTMAEIPETPLFDDVIYAYGEGCKEDLPELRRRGYDVRHIDDELFGSDGMVYGRKLITLTLGLADFGEVLMLDWDCLPVKTIDAKFMEYMAEKPIQIPLYMQEAQNPFECGIKFMDGFAQPNFGFVYSRDKQLGVDLLAIQSQYGLNCMIDEWAMALYPKRKHVEYYIKEYHPKVCFGVDKSFYDSNPESYGAEMQLSLMARVEKRMDMDIYFKHR